MPEPTTTAIVTIAAAAASVPVLTAFGVPLGIRPDLLIAGFAGSIVCITLLDSVPTMGDSMRQLVNTTIKRMFVAAASSITAGYLTPMVQLANPGIPDSLILGIAFAVGGGAQNVMAAAMSRVTKQAGKSPTTEDA
jgi:hypothetical protein